MIFDDKQIILKDGRTAILRSPRVEDAEKLLNYMNHPIWERIPLTNSVFVIDIRQKSKKRLNAVLLTYIEPFDLLKL